MRQVIDPYTNTVLVEMPDCGPEDVSRAVGAAREAFDDGRWSRLDPDDRAACLLKLADLIDEHHDDLALLESSDVGKPISGTTGWDISNAATMYRYYGHLVDEASRDLEIPGAKRAYQRREPLGVVAALVPWNFPFPCISWKIGPALAAGCCVVVKSAERAPLSAQALARLATDAGFPPGVVNVVMGPGPSAGAASRRRRPRGRHLLHGWHRYCVRAGGRLREASPAPHAGTGGQGSQRGLVRRRLRSGGGWDRRRDVRRRGPEMLREQSHDRPRGHCRRIH
ncbi:MAG: aldehyde dehydrogenase family protein [Solirubrobacterales bacterium]|nr:aldehyde dehydrogenase family protein [Solirubrobacterales bacterium]